MMHTFSNWQWWYFCFICACHALPGLIAAVFNSCWLYRFFPFSTAFSKWSAALFYSVNLRELSIAENFTILPQKVLDCFWNLLQVIFPSALWHVEFGESEQIIEFRIHHAAFISCHIISKYKRTDSTSHQTHPQNKTRWYIRLSSFFLLHAPLLFIWHKFIFQLFIECCSWTVTTL